MKLFNICLYNHTKCLLKYSRRVKIKLNTGVPIFMTDKIFAAILIGYVKYISVYVVYIME